MVGDVPLLLWTKANSPVVNCLWGPRGKALGVDDRVTGCDLQRQRSTCCRQLARNWGPRCYNCKGMESANKQGA